MCAFGEMVSLLWTQGREEAAVSLEQLWNRPLGHEPLSLLHAYPAAELDEADVATVSALHARVTGADGGVRIA